MSKRGSRAEPERIQGDPTRRRRRRPCRSHHVLDEQRPGSPLEPPRCIYAE